MTRTNNSTKTPAKAGTRKRYTKMPMLNGSGDQTVVKYTGMGGNVGTGTVVGGTTESRIYVPGNVNGFSSTNAPGPALTAFYSTAKFLPGTMITWEPSVSFTVSGRVVCGFTDNPEIAFTIEGLKQTFNTTPTFANFLPYLNAIKGLGSVRAWPVWQETSMPFPSKLRRKRFDVNSTFISTADTLDRSMQIAFFVAIEGAPLSTTFGSFLYHDVIDVEGITVNPA